MDGRKKIISIRMMTRSAVFASVFVVLAQIVVPLPFTPVPITLQTLGIMICAVLLTPFESVLAVLVYILMGTVGLPVFAEFSGGIGILFGYTGGFIIGWIPCVWLMSFIVYKSKVMRRKMQYVTLVIAIILFTLIDYSFGLVQFMLVMKTNFYSAFTLCAVPFLPGDIVKSVIVILAFRGLLKLKSSLYFEYSQ